jgi:hypothetical protein
LHDKHTFCRVPFIRAHHEHICHVLKSTHNKHFRNPLKK